MRGLIHIYTGDGKGKTTAGVGLAVRCAGNGGKVLYTQFLKDGTSSELKEMKKIEHIQLFLCEKHYGFTFNMDEKTKKEAAAYYRNHLNWVIKLVTGKEATPNTDYSDVQSPYQLLIMDEAIGACNTGMIDEDVLVDFLKNKPEQLEVALTGRDPSERLIELADYVSEVRKIKHPFDQGIPSRPGIEM